MKSYLLKILIILTAILPLIAVPGIFSNFLVEPYKLKIILGLVGLLFIYSLYMIDFYNKKSIELKKSNFYLPIFGFILWSFSSILWVNDRAIAIETLMQYFSFGLVFMLSINLFNNVKNINSLFYALTLSLVFVSILGLLQYYFVNNLFIQNLFLQSARPGSTFANKNMAAHFVVMVLPLTMVMLLAARNKLSIIAYAVATGIASWFLIYTVARQAYVAIGVELLVLFLFFALDKWKNKDKSLVNNLSNKQGKVVVVGFILVFLTFAANFSNEGFEFGSDENSKISKIQSITVVKGNPRLPAWINTTAMIADHPIVGVGAGQWAVMYPLYSDRLAQDVIYNENTRIINLHNDYLEILANFGLIGFSFLMWLAYLVLIRIWRILRDTGNKYRLHVLGITLSLFGFLVVSLFSFPAKIFLPAFLVFLLLGILWVESRESTCIHTNKISMSMLLIGFIVGLFFTSYSIKSVLSTDYINKALNGNPEKTLLLQKTLNLIPNSYRANSFRGQFLLSDSKYNEAIPYLNKALLIRPYDSGSLFPLASAYHSIGLLDKELPILKDILKYDSKNVRAWYILTQYYISVSNDSKALEAYEKMKQGYKNVKDRNGFGPYFNLIIPMSISFSDYLYTANIYLDLLSKHPSAVNYAAYGKVEYYFLNNKEKALKAFNKALELNSDVVIPQDVRNDLKL